MISEIALANLTPLRQEHFCYEHNRVLRRAHVERARDFGSRPVISKAPVPEGEGWTPLPHSTARNTQLSYKALGLLMELLSRPPGWETSIDKMHSINKATGGHREGRDSMRQAMQELEREGYVTRDRVRQADGSFETVVTARNAPVTPDRRTGYQASVDQASVNQSSVSQASLRTRATETETKTVEEHHATLAAARVAADFSAASEIIDKRLHDLYDDATAMKPQDRRNLLLKFERRKPRIYRDCRNKAINQISGQRPEALSGQWAGNDVDLLSLKYALLHYVPKDKDGNWDPTRDWPAWITPPRRPEHV